MTRPESSKPPRAEPLQPDRPGQGNEAASSSDDREQNEAERTRKMSEQEQAALDNVREGYGG